MVMRRRLTNYTGQSLQLEQLHRSFNAAAYSDDLALSIDADTLTSERVAALKLKLVTILLGRGRQ